MDIEIEEKLKENYDYLTIEVEYYKIKTYKIYISCNLKAFGNTSKIKGIEFYHYCQDNLTFTSNIEIIKHQIDKAIIEFFRKEN